MNTSESRNVSSRMNEILRKKNLSVTESRKKILSLFLGGSDALAHGDIEKKAGEKFDRVTVYRTLQTFVEKGIIHTIPTSDNSVRYALCKDCNE
jgi:Fur family ferric uptake transcriptional regulator